MKEIRYRSERFTARDAFDLAAVAEARPGLESVLAAEVADALPRLAESLRVLEAKGVDALAAAINPVGEFASLLPHALAQAAAAVTRAAAV